MNYGRKVAWALALAGLAAIQSACKVEAAPPSPGTATVSLITPTSDDGAVLFSLTGPGIRDALTASSNYNVYWRSVSATELRLLVVGNLVNGNIATVTVDDVRRLTQYDAAVLEVSSRDDAIRSSLTGYGIRLSR